MLEGERYILDEKVHLPMLDSGKLCEYVGDAIMSARLGRDRLRFREAKERRKIDTPGAQRRTRIEMVLAHETYDNERDDDYENDEFTEAGHLVVRGADGGRNSGKSRRCAVRGLGGLEDGEDVRRTWRIYCRHDLSPSDAV